MNKFYTRDELQEITADALSAKLDNIRVNIIPRALEAVNKNNLLAAKAGETNSLTTFNLQCLGIWNDKHSPDMFKGLLENVLFTLNINPIITFQSEDEIMLDVHCSW